MTQLTFKTEDLELRLNQEMQHKEQLDNICDEKDLQIGDLQDEIKRLVGENQKLKEEKKRIIGVNEMLEQKFKAERSELMSCQNDLDVLISNEGMGGSMQGRKINGQYSSYIRKQQSVLRSMRGSNASRNRHQLGQFGDTESHG